MGVISIEGIGDFDNDKLFEEQGQEIQNYLTQVIIDTDTSNVIYNEVASPDIIHQEFIIPDKNVKLIQDISYDLTLADYAAYPNVSFKIEEIV